MFDLRNYHYLDQRLSDYIFSLHTPLWDQFFMYVTLLGNFEIIAVITAICMGWFLYTNKDFLGYLVLIVVSGSIICTHLLKLVFARPRPELQLLQLETFSFPSGHATSALALYGIMAYILFKLPAKNPYRYVFIPFLLLIIVGLVGFSRIYLGYHYFSDVMAGYMVGALWVFFAHRYIKSHKGRLF